jgi:poly(A) polymerase
VCEGLQAEGYKAYVVGGAVRDLIAGIAPKDYDVATSATPEQVTRRVPPLAHHRSALQDRARDDGSRHDRGDDLPRRLRCPRDRRARPHPARQRVRLEEEDAARRDFTVNALYYDPSTETVIDYHHGVADLEQKTLRMIGDPRARYREDPVRMLRAVRLAAKLGLMIDPDARDPIREMASLLQNVPPARLFDEMLKLLLSGHAVACVTPACARACTTACCRCST